MEVESCGGTPPGSNIQAQSGQGAECIRMATSFRGKS